MPVAETMYSQTSPLTWWEAGTPGGYGVIECKRALRRRAEDHGAVVNPKFNSENLTYGAQAAELCALVQGFLGLQEDGKIGPATMRAIFKPDLFHAALDVGVDAEILCKLVSLESGFNPSAFNPAPWLSTYSNGTRDRGITEINSGSGISDADAFNVLKAFAYTCGRIDDAIAAFGEVDVAIASYNVGNGGARTYKTARDYIALVNKQVC